MMRWWWIVPALSLAIGSLKRPAYKKNATMKVTLKPIIIILYWSTNHFTQNSDKFQPRMTKCYYHLLYLNNKLQIKNNMAINDRCHVYMTSFIIL